MIREGMLLGERYEIISKIGAGGMSDVYKAKDHRLDRFVAVKVLKSEYSEDRNFVAKFRTEAQSAAALIHPNIVNVYDVGQQDGLYYIVMELVEGITLKHYIEKKLRLSVKEAVSITIQVSMGLEAAHLNHVIHRDVKPQNIIISKEGKVKVTDFGIARAATSDTITSNVMGSVHYTSPEQARGGYSDEKSDIYSLGIVLFEMVTGRVPFDGETTVSIAIKQIQEPMPDPRDYVDDIPVSVQQIIYKSTEKNPDRRYSTMTELIADLKRSLTNPEENFVRRIGNEDIAGGATKLVTDNEREDIKRQTGSVDLNDDVLKAYAVSKRREQEEKRKDISDDYEKYIRDDYEDDYSDDDYEDDYPRRERRVKKDKKPAQKKSGRSAKKKAESFVLGRSPREDRRKERLRSERAASERAASARKRQRRLNDDDDDDDYDDDDLDPGMQTMMTALAVIAVIILIVIIIVFVRKYSGLLSSVPTDESSTELYTEEVQDGEMVTMTDVSGIVFADAKTKLTAMGLVVTSENRPSSDIEKGCVISVSDEDGNIINPGDQVGQGSTVILSVSTGEGGIEVPDITGLSKAEARVTLENSGFTVAESEAGSDEVQAGNVISQNPAGGTQAEEGSRVLIVISSGATAAATKTVPDLVGMTEIAAKAALAAADISFGEVNEENSLTVAAGVVISQSPEAGATVGDSTSVSFKVSKGPGTFGGTIDVAAPAGYTEGTPAQITITSSVDNSVLYSQAVSSFPAQVTISGVMAPSGVMAITYSTYENVEYEDDSGQIISDTKETPQTVTQVVNFTAE
ncbi:MAG: Stk1 family PASTA domain-containing Ser/Thr kinase [Lachnospiraceae bacterium]|nr:Stk1 family PASTA domain-containing Ser/Thr kinase [Lachnospiraceae bacterium]